MNPCPPAHAQPTSPANPTYQTVRLGRGRHQGPGRSVCVMELASMLAGERFSDRPRSVCPLVGALMRIYNDSIDDRRRQDLYRYVSSAVGTRGTRRLERRRATRAVEWAAARRAERRRRWWRRGRSGWIPDLDDGPELVVSYVIESIRRHTDATHAAVLALLDELIAMSSDGRSELRAEPASMPAHGDYRVRKAPVSPETISPWSGRWRDGVPLSEVT